MVFYRAIRWDNRQSTYYPIPQLVCGLIEPWEMAKWDINQHCLPHGPLFAVIDSMKSYHRRSFTYGTGDFILFSKKLGTPSRDSTNSPQIPVWT
jgi:hypothetical protein